MGFRVVLLENEVQIRLKLDNLIVRKEEKDIWIPLSDISMLVIDNMRITVTARVMASLANYNIGVIWCDQNHLPIGFYCSYDNHSRISKQIRYQIAWMSEDYDRIWKEIVKSKIQNQYGVLQKLEKNQQVVDSMKTFCQEVEPGDLHNREANAAKIYFNELMGTTFSRGNEDILLNAALDYGYSIIRSYIAKLCVGYGLNCQLGIHHRSEYNRYNLVDDLIEPFRPFVDYYAYILLGDDKFFTGEHRHRLINMLNHVCVYNKKNMYLCNALEKYVENYAAILMGRTNELVFPDINEYWGKDK